MIANGGIRVGGTVVEELGDMRQCEFGWSGLLGGKGTKGNQDGGVNGSGIVEEYTNDFLDAFLVSRVEGL